MPQLDSFTFFSEVFWIVLLFIFTYFIVTELFLPTITKILKMRIKKYELDMLRAASYKQELSDANAYFKLIRNSLFQLQEMVIQTQDNFLSFWFSSVYLNIYNVYIITFNLIQVDFRESSISAHFSKN